MVTVLWVDVHYMSAYISYEKRQIIIPGLKIQHWEFPGGSVVKTLGFHCRSMGLIVCGKLRSGLPSKGEAKKKKKNRNAQWGKWKHCSDWEKRLCRSLSHVQLFATPRNSPGQNAGMGSHSLCQGILPTQGSNPGLLHCGRILYQLSYKEWESHLREMWKFPVRFYFPILSQTLIVDQRHDKEEENPYSAHQMFIPCLLLSSSCTRHWGYNT